MLPAISVTPYQKQQLDSRPSLPPPNLHPPPPPDALCIWISQCLTQGASLTLVNPDMSLLPRSTYGHRWCTLSSWTESPWRLAKLWRQVPEGNFPQTSCRRRCCWCRWWHCCWLDNARTSASGCPWRAAGRWGQRRWGRKRWGSWHLTASLPTGSVRQLWSSSLKKKGWGVKGGGMGQIAE